MKINKSNTILYCDRYKECLAFYGETLNLPISHSTDWFVEFKCGDNAFVSIADIKRSHQPSNIKEGITLSFCVDDVVATNESLIKKGVKTTPIKKIWNAQSFFCYDPDESRIEFWQAQS